VTEFQDAIARAVERLRVGEVVSFGDIADDAGRPGAHRAVGAFLASSLEANAAELPWWRVVYSDGHLPPCAIDEQTQRLRGEGVTVNHARVRRSPSGRFTGPGTRRA
jgi:methylated-DNA-protein-cysteine methyltransferase related protein